MSFEATGFLISGAVLCALVVLFRYEAHAGVRVAERMRTHFDFLVLKVSHKSSGVMRFIGRDLLRQIFHYIFHTFLKLVLFVVKRSEQALHNIMQVNKTLAKNAERESETRSKLEEIALHKVETALTEDQKRKHKEKILNGM